MRWRSISLKKNLPFPFIETALDRGLGPVKKLFSILHDQTGESLKNQLAFFSGRGSRVPTIGLLKRPRSFQFRLPNRYVEFSTALARISPQDI